MKRKYGQTELTLEIGDITEHEAEAIVNAANSTLLGGGGVDGAIHRAGGPTIVQECMTIRERSGGCPSGGAVITNAGDLAARKVIHTVGPVWSGGDQREAEVLENCYTNSLALAVTHGLRTIAFPSISTGVFGYPMDEAAHIAITATRQFLSGRHRDLDRVTWVLYDQQTYNAYAAALRS